MKRVLLYGALAVSLAGCSSLPSWLQANGASASTANTVNTVLSTAVADGNLFCSIAGVVAAVPGVNVKNASAQSVANACQLAQVVGAAVAVGAAGVPVPPPAAATPVPIAVVPPLAAAAVAASVKPAS
jgi:hypothetical protein